METIENNTSLTVSQGHKTVSHSGIDTGVACSEFPNFTNVNIIQQQNHVYEHTNSHEEITLSPESQFKIGTENNLPFVSNTSQDDSNIIVTLQNGHHEHSSPHTGLFTAPFLKHERSDSVEDAFTLGSIHTQPYSFVEKHQQVDKEEGESFTSMSNSPNIDSLSKFSEYENDNESRDSIAVSDTHVQHSDLRSELLAALSRRHAATPDTDALSIATTESIDADDSSQKSDFRIKVGRRRKHQDEEEDDWEDDKDPVAYEVKIGLRILKEFLIEANKSLTWPFINAVDPERDGVEDYYEKVSKPMWLNKMKEKFKDQEYTSITDFVSDFRLMLENCYRYNGPDHPISKKAQRLETMLEQKLSLLSRELREKTSISGNAGAGVEEKQITGSRRRKVLVPHDSTALLNQLRLEQIEREKEARRMQIIERKQQHEAALREVDDWEEELVSEEMRKQMKTMWEIPQIGHFLFLCQGPLNIGEVMHFELERCFMLPKESSAMQRVMTSLLSTPYQRTKLHRKPLMPYKVWEEKLRVRVRHFYKVFRDSGMDVVKTCQKLGLDEKFFKVVGIQSPLERRKYHELSFYQRVWLMKGLCDYCLESHESLREAIEAQPQTEQRDYVLGSDSQGNSYLHFPQFCGADVRIYRQSPIDMPTIEIPKLTPKKSSKKKKATIKKKSPVTKKVKEESVSVNLQRTRHSRLRQNPRQVQNYTEIDEPTEESSEMAEDTATEADSGISESELDDLQPPSKTLRPTRRSAMTSYKTNSKTSEPSTLLSTRSSSRSCNSTPVPQTGLGRVTRSAWKRCVEDITPTGSRASTPSVASSAKKPSRSTTPVDEFTTTPDITPASTPTPTPKKSASRNRRTRHGGKSRRGKKSSKVVVETKTEENQSDDGTMEQSKDEQDLDMDTPVNEEILEKDTANLVQNETETPNFTQNETETVGNSCGNGNSVGYEEVNQDDDTSNNTVLSNIESNKNTSSDKGSDFVAIVDVNCDKSTLKSCQSEISRECDENIKQQTDCTLSSEINDINTENKWISDEHTISSTVLSPFKSSTQLATPESVSPLSEQSTGDTVMRQFSTGFSVVDNDKESTQSSENSVMALTECDTVKDTIVSQNEDISLIEHNQVNTSNGNMTLNNVDTTENKQGNSPSSTVGTLSERDFNNGILDTKLRIDKESESVSTVKSELGSEDNKNFEDKIKLCDNVSSDLKDKLESKVDVSSHSGTVKMELSNDVESVTQNDTNIDVKPKIENHNVICDEGSNNVTCNEGSKTDDQSQNTPGECNSISDKTMMEQKDDVTEGTVGDAAEKTESMDAAAELTDGEKKESPSTKEEIVEDIIEVEPEILVPDESEFELVVDSVDCLRKLAEQFEDPPPTIVGSGKREKVIPGTPRKRCERDLRSRLLFLLKELEPWEGKLLAANRKAKLKLKREQENYVEEPDKDEVEDVWESEPEPTSDENDSNNSSDYDPEENSRQENKIQTRSGGKRDKKKPVDVSEDSQDLYMEQTEEYGISSKGRIRKRRIIPNNIEDQSLQPKKSKSLGRDSKKSASTPQQKDGKQKAQVLKTVPQSSMRHLTFNQSTVGGSKPNTSQVLGQQTLVLKATVPGLANQGQQFIQIPGALALKNPALLNQLIGSQLAGRGYASGQPIVLQGQNLQNAQKLIQNLIAQKKTISSVPSTNASGFQPFQFKTSNASAATRSVAPTVSSVNQNTMSATVNLAQNQQQICLNTENKHSSLDSTPSIINTQTTVITSPTAQTTNVLSPQKLVHFMTSSGVKAVPLAQLPPQLQAQFLKVQQQNQAAKASSPPQQQRGLPVSSATMTASVNLQQLTAMKVTNPGNVLLTPSEGGNIISGLKTGLSPVKVNPNALPQVSVAEGTKKRVVEIQLPSAKPSPLPASCINPERPKYAGNVTVKELLEKQQSTGAVSNILNSGATPVLQQSNTAVASPQKTVIASAVLTSPLSSPIRAATVLTTSLSSPVRAATVLTSPLSSPVRAATVLTSPLSSPVRAAAFNIASPTKGTALNFTTNIDNPTSSAFSRTQVPYLNVSPESASVNYANSLSHVINIASNTEQSGGNVQLANKQISPLQQQETLAMLQQSVQQQSTGDTSPGSRKLAKIAVLAKTPQGNKQVAVVDAAKLQQLIAKKQAIDNAVKQVITEVHTSLPTANIKISSPFSMPSRHLHRPCTITTSAMKHPIPSLPPVSSTTITNSNIQSDIPMPTTAQTSCNMVSAAAGVVQGNASPGRGGLCVVTGSSVVGIPNSAIRVISTESLASMGRIQTENVEGGITTSVLQGGVRMVTQQQSVQGGVAMVTQQQQTVQGGVAMVTQQQQNVSLKPQSQVNTVQAPVLVSGGQLLQQPNMVMARQVINTAQGAVQGVTPGITIPQGLVQKTKDGQFILIQQPGKPRPALQLVRQQIPAQNVLTSGMVKPPECSTQHQNISQTIVASSVGVSPTSQVTQLNEASGSLRTIQPKHIQPIAQPQVVTGNMMAVQQQQRMSIQPGVGIQQQGLTVQPGVALQQRMTVQPGVALPQAMLLQQQQQQQPRLMLLNVNGQLVAQPMALTPVAGGNVALARGASGGGIQVAAPAAQFSQVQTNQNIPVVAAQQQQNVSLSRISANQTVALIGSQVQQQPIQAHISHQGVALLASQTPVNQTVGVAGVVNNQLTQIAQQQQQNIGQTHVNQTVGVAGVANNQLTQIAQQQNIGLNLVQQGAQVQVQGGQLTLVGGSAGQILGGAAGQLLGVSGGQAVMVPQNVAVAGQPSIQQGGGVVLGTSQIIPQLQGTSQLVQMSQGNTS